MAGFTKLFSNIIHSTVWREALHVKVCWVTMLALADKYGNVNVAMPALADAARISLPQCEEAIQMFLGPDPYSRTKDFEGRRIVESPHGGWTLLNHAKYRKIQNEDEKRAATAERVRRFRDKCRGVTRSVTEGVTEPVTDVTECNGESVTEIVTEKPRKRKRKEKVEATPNGGGKGVVIPDEVVSAANAIMDFWPSPTNGDRQPTPDRSGSCPPVPKASKALLANRLCDLQNQQVPMAACISCAEKMVKEWKEGAWIRAAQFFFGKKDDAPFWDYYNAYLTNEKRKADRAATPPTPATAIKRENKNDGNRQLEAS